MGKLEIKNISFKDNQQSSLLKNVSLTIKSGEITCLVGPKGSGKTTLLRIIAGLLTPDSGSVIIDREDITNLPIAQRRIGLVPQASSLLPHLNVVDNITFSMRENSGSKINIALNLLDELGMRRLAYENIAKLTMCQQKNVAILRAIAATPKILLLDEPYANLQPINKEDLIEESVKLIKLNKSFKILVTNNPQEALLYADTIYIMNDGKIEQFGKPVTIYDNPDNLFVAKLFGQLNHFRGKVKGKIIDTPLGKITNNLDGNYSEAEVVIRPNAIAIHMLRIANSISAKIVSKRFAAEGHYYVASVADNNVNVKILSKLDLEVGNNVYLKISKYHLIGC